jgi:hypothetical protein
MAFIQKHEQVTRLARAYQSIDLPRRATEVHVLVNQPVDEHQLPLQATDTLHHSAMFVPSGVGRWGTHVSLSIV